jgi:chromosome segregation ATPase
MAKKRSESDSLMARFRKAKTDGGETPSSKKAIRAGAELEQAYRELLLENQVLLESNHRLHERLARAEGGLSESPAAKQLIRMQRDALADRSRQLREAQYANHALRRRYRKLQEETRRLAEALSRRSRDVPGLKDQVAASQNEANELRQQLAKAKGELAMLTDRYYQLQARIDPALSADRVVNLTPN